MDKVLSASNSSRDASLASIMLPWGGVRKPSLVNRGAKNSEVHFRGSYGNLSFLHLFLFHIETMNSWKLPGTKSKQASIGPE